MANISATPRTVVAPPPILHPERGRTELPAVHAAALRKTYGAIEAVAGLDFDIHEGEVFGLLGPNGAGKTSTISMLATRLRPTAGDATIFGHSVRHAVHRVRGLIGLVPQDIALYPRLTGAENLRFFGRAYRVPSAELSHRVDQLLVLVGLDARRDDYVETYSGGMKRRLNLAVGLVHHPRLLLLDEPTVGVDPHSREHIFQIVENLRAEGAAVLYTTHYMEEAERLCDRIGIMDEGKIIAMGTLHELLASAGCSEVIRVRGLPPAVDLARLRALSPVCRVEQQEGSVRIFVNGAAQVLATLAQVIGRHADRASVEIAPLSLESFFLQLTGKELRD